jgi:hypothetical protein
MGFDVCEEILVVLTEGGFSLNVVVASYCS